MSSFTLACLETVHEMIRYVTHHLYTSAGLIYRYTSSTCVPVTPDPMTEAESGICVHLWAPLAGG